MPTPTERQAVTDFTAGLIYGSLSDGFGGLLTMGEIGEPASDEKGRWSVDVVTAGGTRITVVVGQTEGAS
jgi:hypothetical protein